MICPKCSAQVPDGSLFCNMCGSKLEKTKRKPKTRGNGQGCAIYDPDKHTWIAQVIVGYRPPSDPSRQPIPVKRTKEGFKRKVDALAYCETLRGKKEECRLTMQQLYELWFPWYEVRVDKETMGCYRAAFKHFSGVHHMRIIDITAGDLQKCMDDCKLGHRTHQNMKVTAGLLWKYALDQNYVSRNIAENLFIGKGKSVQREALTEAEVKTVLEAIGKERYAEYVYCLCYLGFRPGEFLSLRKEHYKVIDGIEVLVNGSKTEAGRDRIVVIPPQILDIVRDRLYVPGTEYIFPQYRFHKTNGTLTGFKRMGDDYFNKHVFKPMMARLGIAEGKVPYSARHTYSDKLKGAAGSDKAKAGLMGHTDYAFTQSHYQSTDLDDLLEIVTTID